MVILYDTREQLPLEFKKVEGVSVEKATLAVGDYTARHKDGSMDRTVCERKSCADLFHSFTHQYENEKRKIAMAYDLGLSYVLAIEGTVSEIAKGHTFWRDGRLQEAKKSGIAQVRQIMTIQRKYGIEVWWCRDRAEMAFKVQEFFLAWERIKNGMKVLILFLLLSSNSFAQEPCQHIPRHYTWESETAYYACEATNRLESIEKRLKGEKI